MGVAGFRVGIRIDAEARKELLGFGVFEGNGLELARLLPPSVPAMEDDCTSGMGAYRLCWVKGGYVPDCLSSGQGGFEVAGCDSDMERRSSVTNGR